MKDMVFIKLGGSLITDKSKPFTPRLDVIKRLAKEIHAAREKNDIKLIIGHGGGSFPHLPAKKYQTHKGLRGQGSYRGLAIVQDAASRLNRMVVASLLNAGENAISFQPSASCLARDDKVMEWYTKPLEMILKYDMVPVIYGDIGIDMEKGCCILSTEELLSYLAKRLGAKRIIMCGKVDGIMINGQTIPEVTPKDFPVIKNDLLGSDGIDVTGGMDIKVRKALDLAKNGVETEIINGYEAGHLERALLGERTLGTRIHC